MVKRSPIELEQLADETRAYLDAVEPSTLAWEDPADLRRIGRAIQGLDSAEDELRRSVHDSRTAGRSWGEIGLVLGITRQAAQQRFGRRVSAHGHTGLL